MKTHFFFIILFAFLLSCGHEYSRQEENKLEKKFEKSVARKHQVKRTEQTSTSEKDSTSYHIGYDSLNRIVNNGNHQFYEYDSLGRIIIQYQCVLSRDPTCSKPYIFYYEYEKGNLASIKMLSKFSNDTLPRINETFIYDSQNRLVRHTKFPTDTFTYVYIGSDTNKHSELRTYWVNNSDGNLVKVSRRTTFKYDSLGRKESLVWTDSDDRMKWQNKFYYDDRNRLIMQKDSSLDNYNREPNSCCILYWTNYKYDNHDRLIEEKHSSGSYDNPNPRFQRSIKFQY